MPVENGVWALPDKLSRGFGASAFTLVGGGKVPQFRASEVETMTGHPFFSLTLAQGAAMDVEQIAVETTGAANDALKELKVTLDKFKSTLANDLTAMKAASTRIQSESTQMKQAYINAQTVLTTPDFERAIVNAERMATALQAISQLQQTKVSVAVFNTDALNPVP